MARSKKTEHYIVIDGAKVTMKELVKSDPLFADMILEGSYGDPGTIIDAHTEFTTKQVSA